MHLYACLQAVGLCHVFMPYDNCPGQGCQGSRLIRCFGLFGEVTIQLNIDIVAYLSRNWPIVYILLHAVCVDRDSVGFDQLEDSVAPFW